jgi:XrtN system VIT domain protein
MHLLKRRLADTAYVTGVVLVGISFIVFCVSLLGKPSGDSQFVFIINFILTAAYFFIYRTRGNVESKMHNRFLFLILSLISAFALNRSMTVFENSTNWFSVLLILLCLNYMAFAYFSLLPSWARHVVSFVNGIGMMTFIYLACYLLPLYVLSLPSLFFFGLSYHTYVPLLFVIFTILLQNRISRKDYQYWVSFGTASILVTTLSILFLLRWNDTTKQINEIWLKGGTDMPVWVNAAQKIPHNLMTTAILKGDMVYNATNSDRLFSLWAMPEKNIGESRKHDPLILIATRFSNKLQIDEESRVKILQANQDIHIPKDEDDEVLDRLWSGYFLATRLVNTDVKLWPRCNIAYTEKTITVENSAQRSFGRTGEAIYTFYMPEGSVVTALSLWINGKEEKGILTTKALADTAYKTIVGVEKRDPSVVHWQKGNTVTVRVFPVLSSEQRTFKIGITSPLERINGKLRYENIYFKGPDAQDAVEKTIIDFEQSAEDVDMPASFVSKIGQVYRKEGKYEPFWGIQINDPGLSGCTFSFQGNSYTLKPYHKKLIPVDFRTVYLDLNRSWTKEEFNGIVDATRDKEVFVYDNSLVRLNNTNAEQLWDKLHEQPFSLFPLYLIKDVPHSLLVTKNVPSYLGIDDLEGSQFMIKTRQFLANSDRINVFNMGDGLSLYIRSLHEFRLFRFDSGNDETLIHHLKNGTFPEDNEDDQQVIIHKTDMVIEKAPVEMESNGPDHVMRLFSYNHIMQKLGKGLLFDRPIEDSLVREAYEAYVVTPVSSLVVLEKQKDYDRFGIKNNGNSLGNASFQSKGAAPEPHEWVLIAVAVIGLILIMRKRKYQPALS